MISVLILTKNEERDLPGCLESVAWCDDVHVVDSGSQDRTVEVAERTGARVTERAFDTWSSHQNWCLANVPFKYPWVFYLDADERMDKVLSDQVRSVTSNTPQHVAFRVERRDYLGSRWLRHVQASRYYIRLFRPEHIRYERLVNPVAIVDGLVGDVKGHINHFPFSKGWSHWFERHNAYSSLEARQITQDRKNGASMRISDALFARDFHTRRAQQKKMFYKLPARPFVKFLYLYFLKRGFLDGGAGFQYALAQSIYEYMIILKTEELEGS